jgi:glutamyl-tRNA reductase
VSILVLGASHRSAPVELLERLALDPDEARELRAAALATPDVREAVVLATCNRVEIYAKVDRFHGSVEDLTNLLVERAQRVRPSGADTELDDLVSSLFVHYDAGAVAHLFSVAAGLESMVVGEAQILGQVRDSLRAAQQDGTVGAALNPLFQQALRVGKRAHRETTIDQAGRSLVTVALDEVSAVVGDISSASVAIVGAGSVAALAASTVRRSGGSDIVVLSRTLSHAQRVAEGVGGHARAFAELEDVLAEVDVLISCTGATGVVIHADTVAEAVRRRSVTRPLGIVDLALPHDVDLSAARVSGVTLIGLPHLAAAVGHGPVAEQVAAVESIVAEEVAAFSSARDVDRVAPTVVALREMATSIIAAELDRLFARLPELTDRQRAEVAQTLRREADKLLHEPTVRVKRLAGRVPRSSYAAALAELFALEPSDPSRAVETTPGVAFADDRSAASTSAVGATPPRPVASTGDSS